MKRKILFLLVLLIMVTGCGSTYIEENVEEKYKDYWNYSLGDYTFHTEKAYSDIGGSGGFDVVRYYNYKFLFNDYKNNKRDIIVTNYYDDFNNVILYSANKYLKNILEEELENYDLSEIIKIAGSPHGYIIVFTDTLDSSIDLYDATKGLKFSELDLDHITNNNLKVEYQIPIDLSNSIKDTNDIKPRIEAAYGPILKEHDYKNAKLKIVLRERHSNYSESYIITYDGINYIWTVDDSD